MDDQETPKTNYSSGKTDEISLDSYRTLVHSVFIQNGPTGMRYQPREYSEAQLNYEKNRRLIERARLALVVINKTLDELGYKGTSLPIIEFSKEIIIGTKLRPGYYTPNSDKYYGRPLIGIDISDDIAQIRFAPEFVERLNGRGFTHDQISKLALIHTCREEIFHFVDDTKGILPHTSREVVEKMTDEENRSQQHEVRAREAADFTVGFLSTFLKEFTETIY